ncbi:methylamine utilization protein MauE [Sphaerisporangium krabiense]|uniref:Methylamine utilisation protein MauE domain-containing protein n=1 Tax=Sphaerisporangium krabiense TaxID=763782 RepID=A0A7W8Z993_9ACTN|nr:MauE/DoxX family redox-associated membrane protein [Sphaerisporangium krabiense]MBB5629398.1 hypothetical protein [Sphaerisporangium krabiense]GII65751.1 methylamine utilization protein MauE [Sphaerisporangium krabiense]
MTIHLAYACRTAVALVFLVSFLSKIRSRAAFDAFAASVAAGRVLPRRASRAAAFAVVCAEGVVPVALADPSAAPYGHALAAALLLAFSGVILRSVRRGLTVECRCFGISNSPLGKRHLVRNMLICAVVLVSLGMGSPPVASVADLAVGAAYGALAALPLITFDEIVFLFLIRAEPITDAAGSPGAPRSRPRRATAP